MYKKIISLLTVVTFFLSFIGCDSLKKETKEESLIQKKVATYEKVKLSADISLLSEKEKQMLPYLFEAAKIMNTVYWKQTLGDKDAFLKKIENDFVKKYAIINYGPWDRLDNNKAFVDGYGEKPKGANFYPADMTVEEFEKWVDADKDNLYTIVRRDDEGKLKSVWYSEAYKEEFSKAAELLKEAAKYAEDEGLKNYLNLRADALITNVYQPSDLAWLDMKNNNIDIVIGPIENYEDALFGYKAACEAFILLKDKEWSSKLSKFASLLPDLQKGLPIDPEYKKEIPGSNADLNAYDVVFYQGDCNAGSKTIAINLPNDPEVHIIKGTRKLQLKNAMKAKFDKILLPISKVVINESQRKHVTFNAFFTNTMFHEVAHGMGIKKTIDGKTTVRLALKEQYSAIEEGKADIMGLYLVTQLFKMGEFDEGDLMDNYVTFFASIFRSSRFGAASSHGKANMMRFNYFLEKEAFTRNNEGIYTINFEKMHQAVISLMQKILIIQGDGNYDEAKKWVKEKGVVITQLQNDLDNINESNIPVDIIFEQGPEMLGL
jgi:hypothetical protein